MILEIEDRGAGTPPVIDPNAADKQVAYLTNEAGQQVIYVFDLVTCKAVLYRGDNWEVIYTVDLLPTRTSMIASKAELAWLEACTEVSRAIIEQE